MRHALLILPLVCLALAAPAQANVITVDVASDDPLATDAHCSLREALISAQSGFGSNGCVAGDNTGPDEIVLAAPGPYVLALTGAENAGTNDLDIRSDVTIHPAGNGVATIDAAGIDRVLDIGSGDVVLKRLRITGGQATPGANGSGQGAYGNPGEDGGGILVSGSALFTSLRLEDVTVTGNAAGDGGAGAPATLGGSGPGGNGGEGGRGGGIFSDVPLTLVRTTVSGNRAGNGGAGARTGSANVGPPGGPGGDGGHGGGVFAAGALTVSGGAIDDNRAGDGGHGGDGAGSSGGHGGTAGTGGGIEARDALAVDGTRISGNTAGDGGTAGDSSATGGIGATGGEGGGLHVSAGPATIARARITGNTAGDGGAGSSGPGSAGISAPGGDGGGIAQDNGALTVSDSTIDGNVTGIGGAGVDATHPTAPERGGHGGGIALRTGTLHLESSTVHGNATGGGGVSPGTQASPGDGGGVFAGGTAVIGNSTLDANTAGRGGALYTAGGASLASATLSANTASSGGGVAGTGTTSLTGTLLYANQPQNCDPAAPTADLLYNLEFPKSLCPGAVGDPRLGALAANGGPTMTRLPRPGSPALNAVPAASCPATDQRGVRRPQGAACDIGAVEVVPPMATPKPPATHQLDVTAPHPTVTFARQKLRSARRHGLALRVRLDEPGIATVVVGLHGKRVARVTRRFAAAGSERLVARFTKAGKRRLKGRRVRLSVRVVAADLAGNRATLSRARVLRR